MQLAGALHDARDTTCVCPRHCTHSLVTTRQVGARPSPAALWTRRETGQKSSGRQGWAVSCCDLVAPGAGGGRCAMPQCCSLTRDRARARSRSRLGHQRRTAPPSPKVNTRTPQNNTPAPPRRQWRRRVPHSTPDGGSRPNDGVAYAVVQHYKTTVAAAAVVVLRAPAPTGVYHNVWLRAGVRTPPRAPPTGVPPRTWLPCAM